MSHRVESECKCTFDIHVRKILYNIKITKEKREE